MVLILWSELTYACPYGHPDYESNIIWFSGTPPWNHFPILVNLLFASSFPCAAVHFLPIKLVTSSLADSPLGAADGPRRPCFNHSKTEVRRSPPRADRRARPCPFLYAALKSRTALHPPRAHSLTLAHSVHSPSTFRHHGRRLSALPFTGQIRAFPPSISNPPHWKLDHLPSSVLNPSNHSHNPHLA